VLVPARRRDAEILDDRATDAAVRVRSLRDVTRSNALLGGRRAVLGELAAILREARGPLVLLDVGTGLADIPHGARALAARMNVSLRAIGVDAAPELLAAVGDGLDARVCGDAHRLPFATDSVDVVVCSQLLHHFDDDDVVAVLRELDRVARGWVVIGDLRRSWLAAIGFWLVSWPLGFHRVTRHDGFVSVLRGFTRAELARHVRAATGAEPIVRRRAGFRLAARWRALPGAP
jgi:SAM-dependent methyltransferase